MKLGNPDEAIKDLNKALRIENKTAQIEHLVYRKTFQDDLLGILRILPTLKLEEYLPIISELMEQSHSSFSNFFSSEEISATVFNEYSQFNQIST